MGNFKSFWIFGFEKWGRIRPAKVWLTNGSVFRPLVWGIWIRTGS